MTARDVFQAGLAQHREVVDLLDEAVADAFTAAAEACAQALRDGGKILLFGNGGSAADAQHLAAEMVVRYRVNRRALPALALTTDTSVLTACANDFSFEDIFARQVEALLRPGDVALGISTSGTSPNVLKALGTARQRGGVTVGFAGRDGGEMHRVCDHLVTVRSPVVARVQEMHILLGHSLCDHLEQAVGGPGTPAHRS